MESVEGPKVCVIGLGSMGLGMAKSLVDAGFAVSGYDIAPAALQQLAQFGARAGSAVADAARDADIVVVVVVNAAQTRAVLFGEDAAVAAMADGGVVISSATMSPQDAKDLSARSTALGRPYLDAPISGGATRAASGELTFMMSGPADAIAAARSAIDAMAATVHVLGEEPGIGASFKIVNQLLAGVHIAAACEAMTFAARLGLDLERVYEVIVGSAGNSWMFENRVPHILAADYTPHSAIDIFTKDLGIVADIGRGASFPTQLAGTALQMYLMTAAAGMGRDDDASIARMLAQITGVDLPRPDGAR